MDADPHRLSALLRDIYASALDPTERAGLARKMATAFDATSCLIQTRDTGPKGVAIVGATENCTAFLPDYVDYYYAKDAWAERSARRLGQACLSEELVPLPELLAAEWYNDLLTEHDIHHLVGGFFEINATVVGAVGIHRAVDDRSFEAHDQVMLDLVFPHLVQALQLAEHLGIQEQGRRLGFDALAALAVAVFVVGPGNGIRMMNAAAERVARAPGGVMVRQGHLQLADPVLDDRLRSAVQRAALAPLGRSLFAGETIVLRGEPSGPLSLMVSPLHPDAAAHGSMEPLAVVFVQEPDRQLQPLPQLVGLVYGLTRAETRVLLAIVAGQRIADYAAAAGVSLNTAETQLKSVFAKTGCRRQAELVRKVLSDPLLRLAREPPEGGGPPE